MPDKPSLGAHGERPNFDSLTSVSTPHQFEQTVAMYPSFRQVNGWNSEGILGEGATALLAQDEDLADIPLVVLDAVQPDGAFDARQREVLTTQYLDLVAQSSKGAYRAVECAGHVTIVTHQDYAKANSDAVLSIERLINFHHDR